MKIRGFSGAWPSGNNKWQQISASKAKRTIAENETN
jgi:hypothetical protein